MYVSLCHSVLLSDYYLAIQIYLLKMWFIIHANILCILYIVYKHLKKTHLIHNITVIYLCTQEWQMWTGSIIALLSSFHCKINTIINALKYHHLISIVNLYNFLRIHLSRIRIVVITNGLISTFCKI